MWKTHNVCVSNKQWVCIYWTCVCAKSVSAKRTQETYIERISVLVELYIRFCGSLLCDGIVWKIQKLMLRIWMGKALFHKFCIRFFCLCLWRAITFIMYVLLVQLGFWDIWVPTQRPCLNGSIPHTLLLVILFLQSFIFVILQCKLSENISLHVTIKAVSRQPPFLLNAWSWVRRA